MEQGIDFTIESFKPRKHGPSSDKGKRHNHPKNRRKWQYTTIPRAEFNV